MEAFRVRVSREVVVGVCGVRGGLRGGEKYDFLGML